MSTERRRKISLQHNYAYGIISPVSSPSVLPYNSSSPIPMESPTRDQSIGIPCPSFVITDSDELIEVGEEASVALLGPQMNSGFRRWSLCNFQQSGNPVFPETMEPSTTGTFISDEDLSSKFSRSSSSSSLCKLPGIISSIPARIRKLSADNRHNKQFNVHTVQQDDQLREQLKKMYVH